MGRNALKPLVVFLGLLLSIACSVPVQAQVQTLVPIASAQPFEGGHRAIFTTAVVELNSVPLFRVAAPVNLKSGEIGADDRAMLVDDELQQLVAADRNGVPAYDPSTLRIWTHRSGNDISIVASDARHAVPLTIVTVTSADAKSQRSTADAIAATWQLTLQGALVQAVLKLEPTVEKKHLGEVAEIATVLVIWTAVLLFLLNVWQRRSRTLAGELEGEGSAADQDAALRRVQIVHRLRVGSAAAEASFLITVLAWLIAATWSFAQFSQTTALSQGLSHNATAVVIIWISAAVLNRFCDIGIEGAASNWKIHRYLRSEEQARVLLRAPTAAKVVGHFKTFAFFIIAAFLTLSQLGAPVNSVMTIGGIAAIAITFSAQNFLKDIIGGIAVLYEDQYAIGDVVTINGQTGSVENISLRSVLIRDINGSAVTLSHSAVTSVSNFSRNWSRIDYQLSIGPEGDPDKAIDVIRETIEQLAQDPDAGRGLLLPIEWIGVHAFTEAWTLIRASIRTGPLQQFTLRREINRRVRRRLADAAIPFGPPIEPQFITPL